MWHEMSVSVVLPTYNERDSIARCIEDFFATGLVDEVLVVNNNAAPGTDEEVAKTPARVVHEDCQGYGWAVRRGLEEATGDLIAVCEPDGTFMADDLEKLLVYTRDFDIVYGSRTLGWMIWEQANMRWFLRLGNIVVAKMLQVLFNCRSLSDVGCTYRILCRSASEFMLPYYRIGTSHFGPEMMVRSILCGCRVVQVPVNYRGRVGTSSVTGSRLKAFWLGLRMINLILCYRVGSVFGLKCHRMPPYRLHEGGLPKAPPALPPRAVKNAARRS